MRPSGLIFHPHSREKSRAAGWIRAAAVALIVITLLTICADRLIRPKAAVLLQQETKSRVLLVLEEAACQVMKERESFFLLHRNEAGEVTDFSLDAVSLQALKRDLTAEVLKALKDESQLKSTVPAGSLTGISLLSGRGFEVPFSIRVLSAPELSLKGEFLSAGVNQTRCRLMLHVRVTVYAGVFLSSAPCEIVSDLLLAEQVVVGTVPHYWNGR